MSKNSHQKATCIAQGQVTSPTINVTRRYCSELETTSQIGLSDRAASSPYIARDNATKRRKATQRRKPRRKKGGWPISSGFRFKEIAAVMKGAFHLRSYGLDFSAFVTLRPPNDLKEDQNRKLWCRRKTQNIQRKFTRRGLPFVCLSVFEKPLDGMLHVHLLIHVPQRHYAMLKAMENLPEVDVRLRTAKHLPYILKNRLPMQPEFEEKLSRTLRRKKAAKFRGKRWLFSRDALSIIKKNEEGE